MQIKGKKSLTAKLDNQCIGIKIQCVVAVLFWVGLESLPMPAKGQVVQVSLNIPPKIEIFKPEPLVLAATTNPGTGQTVLFGSILFAITANENMQVSVQVKADSLFACHNGHASPFELFVGYKNDGQIGPLALLAPTEGRWPCFSFSLNSNYPRLKANQPGNTAHFKAWVSIAGRIQSFDHTTIRNF